LHAADATEVPAWGAPTPVGPETPTPQAVAGSAIGSPTLSVPAQPRSAPTAPNPLPRENILLASGTGEPRVAADATAPGAAPSTAPTPAPSPMGTGGVADTGSTPPWPHD